MTYEVGTGYTSVLRSCFSFCHSRKLDTIADRAGKGEGKRECIVCVTASASRQRHSATGDAVTVSAMCEMRR